MTAQKVVGALVLAAMAMAVMVVDADDPPIPDIWKVVNKSFDSRMTVDFPDLEPGTTMMVDELYDVTEEKGMVEVLARGSRTTHNYYSKSQQSFLVEYDNCSVGLINEEMNYKMWGWLYDDAWSTGGKNNFVYGPSALLKLAKDFGKNATYTGGVTIRDTLADQWTITHPDGKHTINYYFAADSWTMPYGHTLAGIKLAAPLVVTVFGPQFNPWNEDEGMINQTVYYEYTDFKPYVSPERKDRFLVREGVACRGRETLDPDYIDPPDAPGQFQVFLETVSRRRGLDGTENTFVFRNWLYYSNAYQLLRIDVNPGDDAQEPVANYKSIHDYNTGIEYRIYMDTGDCEMKALDPNQLGNQVGSNSIGGVIMADPDNLFHLDDKYVFTGFSEARGMKTSRWSAVRDDIYNPDTGKNYKKVVVDYMFNTKQVQLEGEKWHTLLPVRVEVTTYSDNDTSSVLYHETLNLLHMETSFQEYAFNPFHVGQCMNLPTDRTWLKLTFLGDWFHGAMQKPDGFKRQLLNYFHRTTHSSYVRFPEVQLEHDLHDVLYATVLILEPAPYHLQFEQLADRKPTIHDHQYLFSVHDVDSCAYLCLDWQEFPCKSFYKCKGDYKSCYLSAFKMSGGESRNTSLCPHYNKALVTNANAVQMSNDKLKETVDEQIRKGDFEITMTYKDHDGETQKNNYTAIDATTEILGDDPVLVDFIRDDFNLAYRRGKLLYKYTELTQNKISYAVCLAKCLGQISIECETFSYCYNSQTCMLSSVAVEAPPAENMIVKESDCVIVSRSHLNDYNAQGGFVYLGQGSAVHVATNADRCAYYCDNATDFTCRSFDMCLDSFLCTLYDHHTADEPSNMFNTSEFCTHYNRDALVDFTKHPKQSISGKRDDYLIDTTPGTCAKQCEDKPDFACNGFDFCVDSDTSTTTCFLTQIHYSDDDTDITDDLTCDHYSRDYYEGENRNSYANTRSSNYKYGPGDMAGLGVSMLVISVALTFGVIYIYNKRKH